MRVKDLLKLIPSQVRINRKVAYEVLYTSEFLKDDKQLGECRPDHKQILIKNEQSDSEKFQTFIHEVLHAISFENPKLNLTENQVQLLERGLFKILKLNKVFDKIKL